MRCQRQAPCHTAATGRGPSATPLSEAATGRGPSATPLSEEEAPSAQRVCRGNPQARTGPHQKARAEEATIERRAALLPRIEH